MATEKIASNEPLDEILLDLDRRHMRKDLPDFRPGDTVRVHVKILSRSFGRQRGCLLYGSGLG